jgi:DNA-binding beta-propeller fold protein YncE
VLTPAIPPQSVPIFSGFDYVTIDAVRHRVYAAHGGSKALLVTDAENGEVMGQVRVGTVHGVAVDPATGHVFTGNGEMSVSEVDPEAMKVLRTVDVSGPVDAIQYDPTMHRIYAAEDDGTHLFVIDSVTMKLLKTIVIPGHKPEYLAINPKSHEVYQNIATDAEIAVIDPGTLDVKRTIPTPELVGNHPLQYDPEFDQIVVACTNGMMSAYTSAGSKLGTLTVPRFDQCDLDRTQHILACAGSGGITRLQLNKGAAPTIIDTTTVDPGVHTTAIDPSTHAVFIVWSDKDGGGDFVQKFTPAK